MTPSDERRKHYRHEFPVLVPVEYTIQTSGENILSGLITNISASGLCFLTRNSLEKDAELHLRENRYIPFRTAKVLWIQEVDGKRFQVGLICNN